MRRHLIGLVNLLFHCPAIVLLTRVDGTLLRWAIREEAQVLVFTLLGSALEEGADGAVSVGELAVVLERRNVFILKERAPGVRLPSALLSFMLKRNVQ